MKPLLYAGIGAIVSAAMIIACSDDSPHAADAATCDCPAAEPPITAARIARVDGEPVNIDNIGGVAYAGCPAGATVLSGGCYAVSDPTATGLFVRSSGPEPEGTGTAIGWACTFSRNPTAQTISARAHAVCLMPAQ